MNSKIILTLVLGGATAGLFHSPSIQAENWPQWRGPALNGSTTESNLPALWSKTENVAWVTPLPGRCGSTPAIWGDAIFLTTPDEEKNVQLFCLNRADGKVRWKQLVGAGNFEKGKGTCASSSPVTDGKLVIAMASTGNLVAFDFEGKQLWARDLAKEYGKFSILWIYGSSPLLYHDKLYVQVIQNRLPEYAYAKDDKPARDSYLMCLEPATGKELWRHIRLSDAVGESQESYTTPYPYEGEHGTEIIVIGGDYVTSHRADTGEELWRTNVLNPTKKNWWRLITSPVSVQNLILACGPKRDPVFAIKAGGHGTLTDDQIAWKITDKSSLAPDVCVPLVYQGKLFMLDGDKQNLASVDPKTGEKKWMANFGVKECFSASPTGADGKIYCIGENGTVVVLGAGDESKILANFSFCADEAPVRSSIAVSNGQLFIRTAKNLYCIGPKK